MTTTVHIPEQPRSLLTFAALWRHRNYVVATTIVSLLLGAVYVLKVRPDSEARARLLVERQGLTLEPRDAGRDKDFLPTQAEIVKSPAVIEQAVERLQLPVTPERNPVADILANLRVDPLVGTNVLSLRFTGDDPQRTVKTVDEIIASYRDYLKRTEETRHRETLQVLTQREKELRADIAGLQERYRKLKLNSPLLGHGRNAGVVQTEALAKLSAMLTTVKSRRLLLTNRSGAPASSSITVFSRQQLFRPVAEHASDHAASRPVETTPNQFTSLESSFDPDWEAALVTLARMADEGWISVEDPRPVRAALLEAQVLEAEVMGVYTKNHPGVLAVRKKIDGLTHRLQAMVESVPELLRRELQAIRRHEADMQAVYDEQVREAKVLDAHLVEETQLLDEIQRAQAVHDSVADQVKQWQLADRAVANGQLGVSVHVLEYPALAEGSLAANPVMVLGFCGFFGVMAGLVLVHGAQRFQTSEEICE